MDGLCIVGHINFKMELDGAVKGQGDMEEVHYGGKSPHLAVVQMKIYSNSQREVEKITVLD